MNVNSNKAGLADDVQSVVRAFRGHLHDRGLRFTAQRKAVLEAALASQTHFTADQLLGAVRERESSVSLATVYRTLGHLQECGLVREAFRAEGCSAYEAVHGHHDHMLCIRCGKVIEFCDEQIEQLQERVCRRHGFEALDHRMGIRGLCGDCRRRPAKRKDGGRS
jgi:Fur family ferric uptake transcriptional regulator